MDKRELSEKQRGWLGHVEACTAGGGSMKAYAERHGLDLQSFYLWKGRLKKLDVAVQKSGASRRPFAPATLVPSSLSPTMASGKTRIEFSNGVMVEVPDDFNVDAMAVLIKTLSNLS